MQPKKSRGQELKNTIQLTGPTMSETCDTVVPDAAPKYRTLLPGSMWIEPTPPRMAAASFDRNGFHALYSSFDPST